MTSSLRGLGIICRKLSYQVTPCDLAARDALTSKLVTDALSLSDSDIPVIEKRRLYQYYNALYSRLLEAQGDLEKIERDAPQMVDQHARLTAQFTRRHEQQKKIVPHIDPDYLFMIQFRHT